MVLATETILLITHFIIVFVGYSNVFIDFIGNLVNILGFTQLRLFQRNPSALYLTVASIVDFSQLVFPISADITLVGMIPIVISALFSLLAYRNVRHIIRRQTPVFRRRLDRQLTAMILLRVSLFVFKNLSDISFRIYQVNNPIFHD
ncbi:unnamed protein product [Rotaria socialis]|uniref:Uncharacterized protein n=1 Tax=Rotaria socialis TaxID=392032 RepID=A0A818TDR3_9BILA|nr:unnamed protein product [Rotaria socialis]